MTSIALQNRPQHYKKGMIPWNKGMCIGNYTSIHHWLKTNFGYAFKCENEKCRVDKVKKYDWAKKPGYSYEAKRENFIMPCRSCHIEMDMGVSLVVPCKECSVLIKTSLYRKRGKPQQFCSRVCYYKSRIKVK